MKTIMGKEFSNKIDIQKITPTIQVNIISWEKTTYTKEKKKNIIMTVI